MLLGHHFHGAFAINFDYNNKMKRHHFGRREDPWGNKILTAFIGGLNNKMRIARNSQTFAYFNIKTETGLLGRGKKLKPKFHNRQTHFRICRD